MFSLYLTLISSLAFKIILKLCQWYVLVNNKQFLSHSEKLQSSVLGYGGNCLLPFLGYREEDNRIYK
jgi:hypothetical protein